MACWNEADFTSRDLCWILRYNEIPPSDRPLKFDELRSFQEAFNSLASFWFSAWRHNWPIRILYRPKLSMFKSSPISMLLGSHGDSEDGGSPIKLLG
jgi:hypothetical protein